MASTPDKKKPDNEDVEATEPLDTSGAAPTGDAEPTVPVGAEPTVPVGAGESEPDPEVMRAEIETLRAELAAKEGPSWTWRSWWRPLVVGLILVLIAVLGPLSIMARWTDRLVSSTDTYVDVVGPLADDPAVQDAIADRITQEIFSRIDVSRVTDEAINALADRGLPATAVTGLQALAVPLDQGIENFVRDKVDELVQSQAFSDAWEAANREAHAQLVATLTGETNGAIETSGNTVSINLAVLIGTVKQTLIDQGFSVAERIPTVEASFVILESADITRAQNAFRLLDKLSTVLPIITLVLAGIAIAVARNRRLAVIGVGLALAAGMILLGALLTLFRPLYLDAIPTATIPEPAAAAVYDSLVGYIRLNLRGVLLVGLIIAAIAWISGSGPAPSQLRSGTANVVSAIRNRRTAGFSTGAFGNALWTYRNVVRIGLVALVAVYLLFKNPVNGSDVVVSVVLALIVWLVAELLAAPPEREPEPEVST